jgi:hypothetical protein
MDNIMNDPNDFTCTYEPPVDADKKKRDARYVVDLDPTLQIEDLSCLAHKICRICESKGIETYTLLKEIFEFDPTCSELMLKLPTLENMPGDEHPIAFKGKTLDALHVSAHIKSMILLKTPNQPYKLTLAVELYKECNPVTFIYNGKFSQFEVKGKLVPEANYKIPLQIEQKKNMFAFTFPRKVRVAEMIAEVSFLVDNLSDYLV